MSVKRPPLTWMLAAAVVLPVGVRAASWLIWPEKTVDAAMAAGGQELFNHEWKPNDPLAATGDGLGPVFNEASCVACHKQGGVGGGGPNKHNVVTFSVKELVQSAFPNAGQPPTLIRAGQQGVLHANAIAAVFQEHPGQIDPRLSDVLINRGNPVATRIAPEPMPGCSPGGPTQFDFAQGIELSQRNTPALFGAKLIDEIPDRLIVELERRQYVRSGLQDSNQDQFPLGRAPRLPGGRIGRFGWKGQQATLAGFVEAACANELGLGNPGSPQPAPLGRSSYKAPGLDLTQEQCDQITSFVSSLPRPIEVIPEAAADQARVELGKSAFQSAGCADCHTPDVGPVAGIYSDLLLHRMGREFQGGGSYGDPPVPVDPTGDDDTQGPLADEWRTPPLWGVADSAPYLHDGRAATLEIAIELHAGQAAPSATAFQRLARSERAALLAFLGTLRAPEIE